MMLLYRKSIAGFPDLNGHFDFLSYRIFSRYIRSQVPIFAFLFFTGTRLFGQVQTIDDVSKQILLPSPQAASLGKYGDTPVNFHTGGATINIPLYEVKIGSLSLPLSLSYQTSGILVTDIASRVGLGWTLSGEGVVTRIVRGLPDEGPLGYSLLNDLLPYENIMNALDQQGQYVAQSIADGVMDSEPDLYQYNFAGMSGKFFVHPARGIVKVPHNNLIITPDWLITDDNGTQYFFTRPEHTTSTSSQGSESHYISSWYLTRILTAKNEEIIFNYELNPLPIKYGFTMSETDYQYFFGINPAQSQSPTRTFTNQQTSGVRLVSIETRIEKVNFLYDETENEGHGRLDLKDDFRLKGLEVVSKIADNGCSKRFTFETHYSHTGNGGCGGSDFLPLPNNENAWYRLKLDAVVEQACDGEQVRRHSFVYNPLLLPPRCSFDQDHWGYYNGKNNVTLKPRISGMPQTFPIGNRNADPSFTGAESLTEIHYPTGGYTKFEFEPHRQLKEITFDSLLSVGTYVNDAPIGEFSDATFTTTTGQYIQIYSNYYFPPTDGGGATVKLFSEGSPNDPVKVMSFNAVDQEAENHQRVTFPFWLDAGTYVLRVANTSDQPDLDLSASIQYYTSFTETRNTYFGGLRIKSIVDFAEGELITKKRDFVYEDPLILNPISEVNYSYQYNLQEVNKCFEGTAAGGTGEITGIYNVLVRTSSNNFTGGTSQGSHVAYGKVTSKDIGINNGKTVYEYTTEQDYGAAYYPFPYPTSYEHRRGLLTREAHYDANGAILQENINTYEFKPVTKFGVYNVGYTDNRPCADWGNFPITQPLNRDKFIFGPHEIVSEWVQHTSVEVKSLPSGVNTKSTMFYGNTAHLQVTRKEQARSDGRLNLEYLIYPDDYLAGDPFLDLLKGSNIKTTVIEQITAISNLNGSNFKITGGKLNLYSPVTAGLLKEVKFLELAQPIPKLSFKFSNKPTGVLPYEGDNGPTTISTHPNYVGNVFYDSYDNYGNVTQFHTNQGLNVSLKWGYNSSRPLVFIKNATPSEFFYDGFEEVGGASVTNAYAGNKYKENSFTVSFTRPNTRPYTLSYWKQVGGNWNLVKAPLSSDNPVINPGVPIDDVFIYPSEATFSLFNYDPKTFQLSNETGSTHTMNYYFYDKFQRLDLIRDHNRDIVKEIIYYYKINP